ncbi:urease accessory protein UreF [Aspergillus lucknowensis]|uniref:Urease accessory protein UreF n=1 Tax=Aspergillus lucknowensis TaxID=176173 RepID=A0ABR4M3W8_9EURO
MTVEPNVQDLQNEILDLEARLQNAKSRLTLVSAPQQAPEAASPRWEDLALSADSVLAPSHALLLLSDSALPLGSFAYSSGLESYIAHNKPLPRSITPVASLHRFLRLSLASMGSLSLPYVLAAYRNPTNLETFDNDLDASTPCPVAQRASVAQGRALLGVWERAFRGAYAASSPHLSRDVGAWKGASAIEAFSDALKSSTDDELGPKGHFAPLWGVVCLAMGMDARQTAYVFMLNHAKAVLSAAVRASVMGPYQAQSILASRDLQDILAERIDLGWQTAVEDAGQVVPSLDLWVGRHELLYSRIFNS